MQYISTTEENKIENIPEISVIIPCYNAQDTIEYSLLSLEKQTYKNFEVIIVNDGSKDDTVVVIENYANKSLLNIQLISQENKGVSAARNRGLANASGVFVTFLDADDSYQPRFLEILYHAIIENNVDFALCKYMFKPNNVERLVTTKFDNRSTYLSKVDIIRLYSHKRIERVNFWCGIYCKDILRRYNICFPEGIKYGEDTHFFCEYVFYCIKGGGYVGVPLYEYANREDSATHNINYVMIQSIDVYKKISAYWSVEKDFVVDDIGRYLVNRAIWGVAKKLALSPLKDDYVRLQQEYNVREAMQYMAKYGDEKVIRISARMYCICSELFRVLVRLYTKMKKG